MKPIASWVLVSEASRAKPVEALLALEQVLRSGLPANEQRMWKIG